MDMITYRMADTLLVATTTTRDDGKIEDCWYVQVTDLHSGEYANGVWTQTELNAIVCLAFAGESELMPKMIADGFYKIAEPALAGWKSNVRPIP